MVYCFISYDYMSSMTYPLENGNASEISEMRNEIESLRGKVFSMNDTIERLTEAVTYLITKNPDPEDEFIRRFLHLDRIGERKRKDNDNSSLDKKLTRPRTELQPQKHATAPTATPTNFLRPTAGMEIVVATKQPKETPCLKKMEILSEAASWLLEPQ